MSDADRALAGSVPPQRVSPTNSFVAFERKEIEQSIPQRFERIAQMHADRIAVKTGRRELTYEALNRAADCVAAAIAQRHRGKEEPIGVMLGDDAAVITALLGILEAGGTYVPLDPSLPAARNSIMLEDSGAALILTDNANFSSAGDLAGGKAVLLNIDEIEPGIAAENPRPRTSPDAPAWILYTSGSTGRPKGVVQTHRNVLHFTMNYTNGYHVSAEDRHALLFSCAVNAGCHDIFIALLNGASLYAFDVKREGLAGLGDWLIANEITIYNSVPTLFRHFVQTLAGGEEFPHLRLVRMAGEPVFKRDVEEYKKHFSRDCIFVNRLGSTETGSIRWYFIDHETKITTERVPVGYAVGDNDILLLADEGTEVAAGEIGEIAVRSRYLSPGYWRRPDLTKEKFLPDPDGPDRRIYRTGDMGRIRPDGCLEHLGRKDYQVKIRGYRVETAEVESALLALESVREAVVVARGDSRGEGRLVAYIVPAAQAAPTVTALRRPLAERLPDYMVPSAFVILGALPVGPNGKILLSALPFPGRARPQLEVDYAAPRTPLEKALGEIWGDVLGLDEVGIDDSFLELGGHSLLAAQVVSRVLKAFQVAVPPGLLLEAPTVADMALAIASRMARKAEPEEMEKILKELEERRHDGS